MMPAAAVPDRTHFRVRSDGSGRLLAAALLLTALATLLVLVPSARAASPITGFYAGPIASGSPCNAAGDGVIRSANASTHTNFCVAYATQTDPPTPIEADDLKQQIIDLPTGFAAMAAAIPTCALNGPNGFNADTAADVGCDPAAQVGYASAAIRTQAETAGRFLALRLPLVQGRVYNLARTENDAALLGIVLDPEVIIKQPKVKVIVRVTLRPAPDVGLRSIIDNLPTTAKVIAPRDGINGTVQTQPLAVDQFGLTLWGAKADNPGLAADFAFLGSDCTTDQVTTDLARSYDGTPTRGDAEPYRLTGCDNPAIPFSPSVEFRTDENRPDVTTASQVITRFAPSTTPGIAASTVKAATVTLPDGLSLSGQIASGAQGLRTCSADQFGQTAPATNSCPSASAVGTVAITSPALDTPLGGYAFLGPQPAPGELPSLYVEAQTGPAEDAPRVKLVGTLRIDAQNRVVATLDDLPQLPVSEFTLTFRGGNDSVLVTPPTCGTTVGSISGYAQVAPATPVPAESSYSVTEDCGAVNGFAPSVDFRLDDTNSAGKSSPLTVTLTRPDRSQRISSTNVNLPPGMLANLKGVPECSLADGAAGTCSAASRIGSITGLVGVGPTPYATPGDVFLTERRGSNVAGLAFRVPVVLGDVDLGVLNVAADVVIRASDQGLRVDAAVPERFKGIPLNLRSLIIRLDRPGFALSPSSCAPLSATSSITSFNGAVASPSGGLQVSGCEALTFAPQIQTAVSGSVGKEGRPLTQVRVSSAAGSSALRQAFVELPKGLVFDLRQVPRACSTEDFAASKCPYVSKIGEVSGTLSITDDPLTGSLFLLKPRPNETLPGIGLAFEGRYAANVAGQTRVNTDSGQLVTAFETLPDLPLTGFQIDVSGGRSGVLVSTAELCDARSVDFEAMFVGYSGRNAPRTSESICGIPLDEAVPTVSGRVSGVRGGRPTLAVSVTAPKAPEGKTAKRIARVELTMPARWSISSSRVRSSSGVTFKSVSPSGKSSARKLTSRTIRFSLPTAGSERVKLYTRSGALSISSSSARRTKSDVEFAASVVFTDGTRSRLPLWLKPR